MHSAANLDAPFYDVVVVGGALSGAATATLLLRQNPGLRCVAPVPPGLNFCAPPV
jgi:hypothetical protein